jgi:hypothetical protein
MPRMNRRHFLHAALSTLFIPRGMPAAPAAAPDAMPPPDYFFYDDRFIEARRLAGRLSAPERLTPVQGDMTGVWNAGLDRACARSPLTLQGVTTESFYFCLKIMAASTTGIETSAARVGRDLFLWTIHSGGALHRGAAA